MQGGKQVSRLFIPSLVVSSFATQPSGLLTGLLLVDIGLTFGSPVGVIGQIFTAASIFSVIAALIMSILSIRYNQKTLLLIGTGLLAISALGCGLATSYIILMVFYALTGISRSMVNPMSSALIGEYLREEERSGAIGWVQAGTSIAYLVGSPTVSYLGGIGGWRYAFFILALPMAILGLIATFIGIPSHQREDSSTNQGDSSFLGFWEVLGNRSALFCLLGTIFAWASWSGGLAYMMSYYRESFGVSTFDASILLSGLAVSKTVGHLTFRQVVEWLGRKRLMVYSVVVLSFLMATFLIIDVFWFSIVFVVLLCFVAGYVHSSLTIMSLDQVPEFRGSMMSLNTAAFGVGGSLGTGLGGYVLLVYGYGGLGLVLGLLCIISAVIFHFLTLDPIKT